MHRRQIAHNFAQGHGAHGQVFEQAHGCHEPVHGGHEVGENEAARAIAHQQRVGLCGGGHHGVHTLANALNRCIMPAGNGIKGIGHCHRHSHRAAWVRIERNFQHQGGGNLVVDGCARLIHKKNLLAAHVQLHTHGRVQRRDDFADAFLILAELVMQHGQFALICARVERDHVNTQFVDNPRQHIRRRAIGEVEHNLEPGRLDTLHVHMAQEGFEIRLHRLMGIINAANVVEIGAAEVGTEEIALHNALAGCAWVEPRFIQHANVNNALVEGAQAHVQARRGVGALAHKVAQYRNGHGAKVPNVNARPRQAANQRAFEHARAAMLVTVDGDVGAFGQRGAERRTQLGGKFRCKFDIDHARNTKAAKERASPLVAPDDALLDDGAWFNFLARPELDIGVDDTAFANDAVVANHSALKNHNLWLEAALAHDYRTTHLAAFANVIVAPDDTALNQRVIVHHRIIAHDSGAVYAHAILDLHLVAQIERAKKMGIGRNFHVIAQINAAAQMLANGLRQLDAPVEHIGIGAMVLLNCAHVAPVALGNVAVEGQLLFQHGREEILGEIKLGVRRDHVQNFGLEHVNARVDRIRDNVAPGRLLEEAYDRAIFGSDNNAILGRVGHARQRHCGQRALFGVGTHDLVEIKIG